MLGVSERFLELQDPIFLYYSSFLTPSEDTKEIQDIIEEIYSTNNIAEEARTAIEKIRGDLYRSQKQKTKEGTHRKDSLVTQLVTYRQKLLLHMEVYADILPLFQKFVKMMQAEKPMCHLLHQKMFNLVTDFMSFFAKSSAMEVIRTPSDLSSFCLRNQENKVGDRRLAVGARASTRMKKLRRMKKEQHWISTFYLTLRQGYEKGTEYLIKNLPIRNVAIASLSGLDPNLREEETTEAGLTLLAEKLPSVLNSSEVGKPSMELKAYARDKDLDTVHQLYKEKKQPRID
ncbi:hypothetical protein ACOMHN_041917 [Nucella lapillus]